MRDAIVMCCKRIDSVANGFPSESSGSGWLRFPGSCFCCVYMRLPVAPHVPVAHAFARQQVQGNQGEWLHVDYILIDFVGPSMKSWLMTVNHRWTAASSDMLRKAFLSLMVLICATAPTKEAVLGSGTFLQVSLL